MISKYPLILKKRILHSAIITICLTISILIIAFYIHNVFPQQANDIHVPVLLVAGIVASLLLAASTLALVVRMRVTLLYPAFRQRGCNDIPVFLSDSELILSTKHRRVLTRLYRDIEEVSRLVTSRSIDEFVVDPADLKGAVLRDPLEVIDIIKPICIFFSKTSCQHVRRREIAESLEQLLSILDRCALRNLECVLTLSR